MLKERAAARFDAILSGGNTNPGQNPGQSDPQHSDDQKKSSNSLGDLVTLTFNSWNQIIIWLGQLGRLRAAA